MKTILEKYLLPLREADNENGAVSPPAADVVLTGADVDEGTSSTSEDDDTGSEEGEVETQAVKAAPSNETEKKTDWRDKKIAKLTARLKESQQKPAAVETPDPAAAAATAPTDQFNKMVAQEAAKQRQAEDFTKQCDNEAKAGMELYGANEFKERLGNLLQLIDQDNVEEATNYYRFLNAALETGKAKDIIFQLGDDLEEAEKIFSMNDVKMGVKLARMADSIEAPAPETVSGAAKPITTVGGRSGDRNPIDPADARGDQLSTAEWMKRRNAQVDARKAR